MQDLQNAVRNSTQYAYVAGTSSIANLQERDFSSKTLTNVGLKDFLAKVQEKLEGEFLEQAAKDVWGPVTISNTHMSISSDVDWRVDVSPTVMSVSYKDTCIGSYTQRDIESLKPVAVAAQSVVLRTMDGVLDGSIRLSAYKVSAKTDQELTHYKAYANMLTGRVP